MRIQNALLSVSDKTGLVDLAKSLESRNVTLYASGGTLKHLQENHIKALPVESISGNPEAFAGRMKTISFQISSGLLYNRQSPSDCREAEHLKIPAIDLVVCNLYPFIETTRDLYECDNAQAESQLVEKIDVGGPTMIRSGAKNYQSVAVLTHPKQYLEFVAALDAQDENQALYLRRKWSITAFEHLASYDQAIVQELRRRFIDGPTNPLPPQFKAVQALRYGENPFQTGFFIATSGDGFANLQVLQGKELSYNNLLDADKAYKLICELNQLATEKPYATAIIKHNGPCGVAMAQSGLASLILAWAGDPVSSFGSIIAFNQNVDLHMAKWLTQKFVEVIIAPDYDQEALKEFSSKKNLRLIKLKPQKLTNELNYRSVSGGLLAQTLDHEIDNEFQCVTKKYSKALSHNYLKFGTTVCKYLRSNALALIAQDDKSYVLMTEGQGQPNRVEALTLLIKNKLLLRLQSPELNHYMPEDFVLVSDAFFPFPDIIEACSQIKIKNIVQPGGSINDEKIIDCCDKYQIQMFTTNKRHFTH